MTRAAAIWCAAAALYLLLAGSASASELATAAIVATATLLWTRLARRVATRRFAGMRGHVGAWGRTAAGLLPATARTGLALARVAAFGGSPGRADTVRFVRGAEDAPAERGRRATALLAASLTPDRYVVRAAPGSDEALLHALGPGAAPDARWLA